MCLWLVIRFKSISKSCLDQQYRNLQSLKRMDNESREMILNQGLQNIFTTREQVVK